MLAVIQPGFLSETVERRGGSRGGCVSRGDVRFDERCILAEDLLVLNISKVSIE